MERCGAEVRKARFLRKQKWPKKFKMEVFVAIIELKNITKTFEQDGKIFDAVKDASVSVEKGEIYGIIGFSGAGKSTLVRTINLLGRPTSGQVIVKGRDFLSLSEKELRQERKKIGMIFQHFNLMKSRNVFENVAFPLKHSGLSKEQISQKVHSLLELVEINDKDKNFPSQLSGGQKQRVAIARALANDPDILLCDEATSALDPKTTRSILKLIRDINQRLGITVIVITHQMSVVEEICSRVAILENGEVVEEGDVTDVFSHPNSQAAKHMVFPESEDEISLLGSGERIIRVVFNGAPAAGTPVITQMAIDEQIAANILYASTRCAGERVYGKMLLGLPDDDAIVKKAIAYLTKGDDIAAEEVKNDA